MELEIIPLALKKIRLRKIPLGWVKETVNRPDQTRKGYLDRKVCQKIYRRGEKEVLLRVVLEKDSYKNIVVTGHI